MDRYHWKSNVINFKKLSSTAAPGVIILTNSGAANADNLSQMMTFPFQQYHLFVVEQSPTLYIDILFTGMRDFHCTVRCAECVMVHLRTI